MKQKTVGLTLRALILRPGAQSWWLGLQPCRHLTAWPTHRVPRPQNLTATVVAPDGSSVSYSAWGAVSDADSYEVWRGDVVNSGGTVSWGTSALTTESPARLQRPPPTSTCHSRQHLLVRL